MPQPASKHDPNSVGGQLEKGGRLMDVIHEMKRHRVSVVPAMAAGVTKRLWEIGDM
jgi:ATP-dependent protease ClpP protease subunit